MLRFSAGFILGLSGVLNTEEVGAAEWSITGTSSCWTTGSSFRTSRIETDAAWSVRNLVIAHREVAPRWMIRALALETVGLGSRTGEHAWLVRGIRTLTYDTSSV